ncbi:MAG: protein kinase domain-containing protein [Dolichospermum sp.]
MIGTTIGGRYCITTRLGQGGFGTTYLAKDTQLPGSPVCVVKHFTPLTTKPEQLQKAQELFEREAGILQELNHPQIPRLLAFFTENQQFFIVQEFIKGHDLTKELPPTSTNTNISEAFVIKLLKDILEVLEYIHGESVIHRDLKPSNVMRQEIDNKIVIIDFGIVKPVKPINNQEDDTQIIGNELINQDNGNYNPTRFGTKGYAPREQGEGKPEFNSDIFSLGMIVIQALTEIEAKDINNDNNNQEISWRYYSKIKVSDQLADILDKMVKSDHRDRYQTVTEVLTALQKISISSPLIPPKIYHLFLKIAPLGLIIIMGIIAFLNRPISECDGKLATYKNKEHNIEIEYPKCWDADETPISVIGIGKIVTFIQPQQKARLIISSSQYSGTLENYGKDQEKMIKSNLESSNIIERSSTIIANQTGQKIIVTGKNEQQKIKNMYVMTLRKNQAYLITYTAPIDDYDKLIKPVEDMIKSLQID